MAKPKVYVDGQQGTVGLEIHNRLRDRGDVEVMRIAPELRRDTARRAEMLNGADVAILCLPDEAAVEAVSLITNPHVKVIDASTAHRTHEDWAYGIPELSPAHRERIATSKRVSVAGCYATGFSFLVYPLVQAGIMPRDSHITCFGLSGYSGAGKKTIALYEDSGQLSDEMRSPRLYALSLSHKHLPEMQQRNGLTYPPLFTPVINNFYKGMIVAVPLFCDTLGGADKCKLHALYSQHYHGCHHVKIAPLQLDQYIPDGFLPATAMNGTNDIELCVFGNEQQVLLAARLDNLGKGASGAAVQCLEIMCGLQEM